MAPPELSVVVPIYNCADCLRVLHARLHEGLDGLVESWEVVFVDDRSPDDAWSAVQELASDDPVVRGVRLSRNFGQHVAITAGIARASGDWVVLMDCDLQDRPEDVEVLYRKALEGYDIVFSRRLNRRQTWFRRLMGSMYFRLRNLLLRQHFEVNMGSLVLFSRKVADAFVRVRDRDRQHGIILAWLGFEAAWVELEHGDRLAGKSSYSLSKLIASAVDGMFFQTTILLRWIVYGGFLLALGGVGLAIALVAFYFVVHPPPGWTSLAVLLLLVGGFIMISLGVTALYIGKIFEQVKDRPLYVVDDEVGEAVLSDELVVRKEPAGW